MDLQKDLNKLLSKIESQKNEYKDLKHQDRNEKCELIYRGKYEAYVYIENELKNLLKWHGILKKT